MSTDYYWSFITEDGDIAELDELSYNAVLDFCTDRFAERCIEDKYPSDGEAFSEDVTFVKFHYDDNDERQIDKRVRAVLEFTYFRDEKSMYGV